MHLVEHLDRDEQHRLIVVLGVVELIFQFRQRAAEIAEHREGDRFALQALVVVRPRRRRFLEDVERHAAIARAEQRIHQHGIDRAGILAEERHLPRADRFLVAAAHGVRRAEIERGAEEIGCAFQRLLEPRRGLRDFALARARRGRARTRGSAHRPAVVPRSDGAS